MSAPITILTERGATELPAERRSDDGLRVLAAELEPIFGLSIDDEGRLCSGASCLMISAQEAGLEVSAAGVSASLEAVCERLDVARVASADGDLIALGPVPLARGKNLAAGLAPDFALPDRQGKMVRLSDFRGKKVLLWSWSSW